MRALLLAPLVALAAALPAPAIAAAPVRDASPSVVTAVAKASPVAGRFCKTADSGKKRRDNKGRMLRCQMKGGHYRWVVIAG
jgi:hypothetical protein